MNRTKWELLVFDLDGTIADTGPDIQVFLNSVLADWRLAPYSLPEVLSFIGNGARVLAQRALNGRVKQLQSLGTVTGDEVDESTHERFFDGFMTYYQQEGNQHTTIYDGVVSFLKTAAVPVALLTNKPSIPTARFIEHFKMQDYFCKVVDGQSAPKPKPDPAGLYSIMQQMGVDPSRTLMVGDGKPDILVARAAGVPCCALLQGFTPNDQLLALNPDWVAPTFADFVSLLYP